MKLYTLANEGMEVNLLMGLGPCPPESAWYVNFAKRPDNNGCTSPLGVLNRSRAIHVPSPKNEVVLGAKYVSVPLCPQQKSYIVISI